MAINRDPAEWFYRPDRWDDHVFGILKSSDGWVVLKKNTAHLTGDEGRKVEEVARVDSRQAAIGYIKLLMEK